MCGFTASASFGFIGGRLVVGPDGWSSFMTVLILITLITTVFTWLFMHGECKVASQDEDSLLPTTNAAPIVHRYC